MQASVLGPKDGRIGDLGSLGVRFMVGGGESGGGFSLVEHPLAPRMLAAPMHRHSREDEYSFVLEGRVGALLGDAVVYGEPGDLIFKPRNQWHTFWNAGDKPARILETSRRRDSSATSQSSLSWQRPARRAQRSPPVTASRSTSTALLDCVKRMDSDSDPPSEARRAFEAQALAMPRAPRGRIPDQRLV